ncbi:hypothetical protein GUJ93_ZPchr0205g6539 [Zizania palustris]|uniref:Uncharacterized protein n=1 Tax=Zizania palustris TaxID=103762 RepID=A0A8J5R1D4_ZIZPA|nr:hypothetical protein GUJ93_ZPchr0205g6539 [Zizania palustris]
MRGSGERRGGDCDMRGPGGDLGMRVHPEIYGMQGPYGDRDMRGPGGDLGMRGLPGALWQAGFVRRSLHARVWAEIAACGVRAVARPGFGLYSGRSKCPQ